MRLPDEWLADLRRVQQHFPEAVLAGGALRDLLLNRPVKDLDIFVSARDGIEGSIRGVFPERLVARLDVVNDEVMRYEGQFSELAAVYDVAAPASPYQGRFSRKQPLPPIQIVVLNGEATLQSVVDRIDFGICRIGTTGDTHHVSSEFLRDFLNRTFTLVNPNREGSSMARYARLTGDKYVGWRLVDPNSFDFDTLLPS